jgi:two-component system, NtrC family, sensor kinase
MIARSLAAAPELSFLSENSFPEISAVLLLLAAALLLYRALLAKRELRSRQRWADTLDSFGDSILVHDDAFRIRKINRTLLRRLGREAAEVLDQPCEAVLPRLHPWQGCPYCSSQFSGEQTDAADPALGGFSQISTSSYVEAASGRRGTLHVVRDVTEQRAAEERYRLFFERVQEGAFVSTPAGKLLDCNQALVRMLGYSSREELLAVDITRDLYLSPQQRSDALRHMEGQDFIRNFEVTLRRKDGTPLHVQESSFAIRDSSGAVVRCQGFLLDVSETKRAEEEMRRRNRELFALNSIAVIANQSLDLEEILRLTFNQVMELFRADTGAVYLFEENSRRARRRAAAGHISSPPLMELEVSQEFWERLQRSRPPLLTRQHLPELPEAVSELVRREGLKSWIWALLWTQEHVAGVLAISSRTPREFTAADENLMIAISRQLANSIEKVRLYQETRRAYDDLTLTQEQLLQSEKMSALGQMISGVAHELNNPLTAILGYAQLLEDEPLEPRHREYLDKIFKQAHRTHRIVQNLLSFARQRKPFKQLLDMRRVLEDTLALRDYDLKASNIAIEMEAPASLPQVFGDAHQLEQVFLNIVNNALDSMLENARGGWLRLRAFVERAQIVVEIHDSGAGIRDPKRIFDPFYTTKPVGKGTGLGLSICYGIIKSHGGEILARNHPQGGAVFQVRLPVASPAAQPQVAERPSPSSLRLRGRILLVDDEEPILELERQALIFAGAEAVGVTSARDAILSLQSETFDAVIADAGITGDATVADLHRWIASNRPGLEKHLALASSSPGDPDLRLFVEQTRTLCIAKPFTVPEFLDLVQRALKADADSGVTEPAIFTWRL